MRIFLATACLVLAFGAAIYAGTQHPRRAAACVIGCFCTGILAAEPVTKKH